MVEDTADISYVNLFFFELESLAQDGPNSICS